jgi:hypothetical protein
MKKKVKRGKIKASRKKKSQKKSLLHKVLLFIKEWYGFLSNGPPLFSCKYSSSAQGATFLRFGFYF